MASRSVIRNGTKKKTASENLGYISVVSELLRYAEQERESYGSTALNRVLLRPDGVTVWVGDGNSGTKGVGRLPREEPRLPSRATADRIAALPSVDRRTAETILDDPYGYRSVRVELRGSYANMDLETRVGIALASDAQRLRWAQALATKNKTPMRGARLAGVEAIEELALAWQAL